MSERWKICRIPLFLAAFALAAGAIVALEWMPALAIEPPAEKRPAERVDFDRDIAPIFSARCNECHSPDKAKGGLKLSSRKNLLAELDSGSKAVVPEKPDESEL